MSVRILLTCAFAAGLAGCAAQSAPVAPVVTPGARGGVTLIRPRCAGVSSCLLGQVVAAETYAPMSQAAVFLELEDGAGGRAEGDGVSIVTMTDDQGVFTVADAPKGRYRLAIYKDARKLEVRGLQLGGAGITMVPVRLPRS